ncbi:hypothetical protein ABZ419_11410 [Streptomyces cinnamoneus]|uniref:hypothetical protein n=1 Tax=Streptomyces cinnamoneus TaxID=53446 RepID=UPI0033F54DF6
MIHAVFNADREVLVEYVNDLGAIDTAFLAHEALRREYGHVPGAFVDELCTRHMEPHSTCRTCAAQVLCMACDWPLGLACAQHR